MLHATCDEAFDRAAAVCCCGATQLTAMLSGQLPGCISHVTDGLPANHTFGAARQTCDLCAKCTAWHF